MSGAERGGIDARCVVSGNPDIPCSRLDGDLLAIDEQGGYCYSMNASAARVWELVATPTAVADVCAVLCGEFEVDQETCMRDVSAILAAMLEAGLVNVANAPMD
jgi:hypothetical protein